MTTTDPDGIDTASVRRWLARRVDVDGDVTAELIEGGRSNLTYRLGDDGGVKWVLRRPPLGEVLATAHDVVREHRIQSALTGSAVPIAPLIGVETGDEVNGAPFYVMAYVEGLVARSATELADVPVEARTRICSELVDVLVEIHSVDVDTVGLGDLGRREGYLERQLRRWTGQLDADREAAPDLLVELGDRLGPVIPPQTETSLVHGDYRLDNCIVSPQGPVLAVLDWELCTLGDPLADVGLLAVYNGADAEGSLLPDSPASAQGMLGADELVALYAERSGRDVSELPVHVAFALFKLAAIVHGVASRYRSGQMGVEGSVELAEMFEGARDRYARTGLERLEDR